MTDSKQSLVPVERYGLDDLMACLTNEPDAEEKALSEPLTAAENDAADSDAAGPSPALAAALDAVLKIAEETVMHKATESGRRTVPALSERLSVLDLAPTQIEQSQAIEDEEILPPELGIDNKPEEVPCMGFSRPEPDEEDASPLWPATGEPIPSLAPMVRQMPAATSPDAAILEALERETIMPPEPTLLPSATSQSDVSTNVSHDDVSLQPAPVRRITKTVRPVREATRAQMRPSDARDLVETLEGFGDTLESAEALIAQRLRPAVAASALDHEQAHQPLRSSRGREAMVLSGLVLCLLAGLSGIVYSNSDLLRSVSPGALMTSYQDDATKTKESVPVTPSVRPQLAAATTTPGDIDPQPGVVEEKTSVAIAQESVVDAQESTAAEKDLVQSLSDELSVVIAEPSSDDLAQNETTEHLVTRAKGLIDAGDISSARQVLEYAARRGNASAMMVLAQSYDPGFLLKMNIHGIRPDVDKAMAWYQRAAEAQPEPQATDDTAQLNVSQPRETARAE